MADILLTHSYHVYYDRKQARKMQPYPPLGTLYAAAVLRQAGFSVAVFDSMLEDPAAGFPQALAQHKPRLVAVYEDDFNFLTKMCLSRMREVAFAMSAMARQAGAIAVVHGSDASDHELEFLRAGYALVLRGEAEQTLLDVAQGILSGHWDPSGTPGLAFRDDAGRVHHTAPREPARDLEQMPFPARDLVDLEPYRRAWKAAHGSFSLNIVSSRGCPYRCNWCAKPIYGQSFAYRTAASVAEEMRQLKTTYGAEHLWFADDIFALKQSWAEDLAAEVERRDAAVPFKMQSRVDLMQRPAVAALKRAGCAEVWMGAESGSQRILDAMEKDTRIEEIVAARENLRRYEIRACYFLQFGYPGESWADIQKTIELVRRTQPDDIGVSVSYPLPGTRFYQRVQGQMSGKKNWTDSEDLAAMFRTAYTSEFYRALHDALHAEVEQWSTPAPAGRAAERSTGEDVHALWARVEELEPLCRNDRPTVLSPQPLVAIPQWGGD